MFSKNWTDPIYLEPRFEGNTFALNQDESKFYYNGTWFIGWRERLGPNLWSEPHVLDAEWSDESLIRNLWIDPLEELIILTKYTNNWQLHYSRKDSSGVWGDLTIIPAPVNTPQVEWWGGFSPSGEWLYFSRYISGMNYTQLRSRRIDDFTYLEPETLTIGEYGINWGGSEIMCTLSPDENEIIFEGYRYWYNDGWGSKDLFSSIRGCDGNWLPVTRLDNSYEMQFFDHNAGTGIEAFPFLSFDNRTLYFERLHWEESDSGLVPGGGYCSSKRIWSKCYQLCPDISELSRIQLLEPAPFQFEVEGSDSINFSIFDESENEIITHADSVTMAGIWQIRWYGINDTGMTISDGEYTLQIQSDSNITQVSFLISGGEITSLDFHGERTYTPNTFQLNVYPNPFNCQTTIRYGIQQQSDISLSIYNLKGQIVWTKDLPQVSAGNNQTIWDGKDQSGRGVNSGVYIIQVATTLWIESRKVVLLK
ncbi:T9SS type A sorting domain-containing protein [bacterium]|nr:T9SS type A sorting domain-containing protein [bacterium]